MENKNLNNKDISYSNLNFWYYYVTSFRGSDDDKEINLDEAIEESIDVKQYITDFGKWYDAFLPEEEADDEGIFEHPKEIGGKLTDEITFTIEFHSSEIRYYLNNLYIGNLGGHFEAWFLTLEELLAFDKYEALFLLLLPMTGVEESQREKVEQLVSQKLKHISMFAQHSDYIAKCIVNGLIIEGVFKEIPEVGITNQTNHSVRNITKYTRYKEQVTELNKYLKTFVGKANN